MSTNLQDIELTEFEGIRLRSKWQIKFVPWTIAPNYKHEENCAIHAAIESELDIDDLCNCNPTIQYILISKLYGWPIGEPKREYHFVSIPNGPIDYFRETVEEPFGKFNNTELLAYLNVSEIKDWPIMLQEDFKNGLQTLFTFLKYNESTGKSLTEAYWFENSKKVDDIVYEKR